MLFDDPSEWANLAIVLGLAPHEPVAGFSTDASFRQLKRSLGPVAGPPPHFRHWLRGRRNGHRVLVVTYVVSHGSHSETWTAAMTEIDPPLFLGAKITEDGAIASFFGGDDVQLGIPDIDAALRLGALDPSRLRALLLARAGDPRFLMSLASHVRAGFRVTDSAVVQATRGRVTNPITIAQALDGGAWIADQLALRRATLPPTPAEVHVQREWRAFAEARGLTFDPTRMHMHGAVGDASVELALETNGGVIQTSIGVRFPRRVALRLHLRKAGALAFLTRLFTDDVKTGDEAFDADFLVEGTPAAEVRQVFSNPALRATLRRIAGAARELTMTEEQVFWLWPGPTLSGAGLHEHLSAAVDATHALFGAAESHGPYR